jgi:hypothetical protein
MKHILRSHQHHDLYRKYHCHDSEISGLLGECGLFWLSEAQVERLRPYFRKSRGKPRVDDRRVLSGIIFIQRNGLMWKHAPAAYGPPKTLYSSV